MELEPRIKNYEIAYILSSSVPEEEVSMHAAAITKLIEEAQGTAKYMEQPHKRRLAYPIKKERNVYFGWTTCRVNADRLTLLDKQVKSLGGMLRHLIIEEEVSKKTPILRTGPRPASGAKRPAPLREEKKEEKLDLEALDKRLEEILGK